MPFNVVGPARQARSGHVQGRVPENRGGGDIGLQRVESQGASTRLSGGVQAEVGGYSVSSIQNCLGRLKDKEVQTAPGREYIFKPLLKAAADMVRSELSKETESIGGQLESLINDNDTLSRSLEKTQVEKDEAVARVAEQERLAAANSELEKLRWLRRRFSGWPFKMP